MAGEPSKEKEVGLDNLTCPVCNQLYNKPKYLPCQHYYCQACLEKIQVGYKIVCPECTDEATLSEGGVNDLPKNFFIARLVNGVILKLKVKDEVEVKCDECDEETVVAYCPECNFFFCNICSESHQRSKRYRDHGVQLLTELRSKSDNSIQLNTVKVLLCQKHDIDLLFYCETCRELICVYCSVKDHAGHKHDAVKEVVGNARKLLKTLSASLDEMISDIHAVQRNVNDMQETITQKGTELDKRIDEYYDRLFQRLMEQKKEIKLRLADVLYFKKKLGSVQLEDLESGKMEMLRMKELTVAAESSSDQEFLSAKNQLSDQMLQLHSRYGGLNLEPTETDSMEFTFQNSNFPQFGKLQSTANVAPNCTKILFIPGYAVKGQKIQFVIVTRDSCNSRCIRGGTTVLVKLESTIKKSIPVQIIDKNDGSYIASFVALQEGKFKLILCIDEQTIQKAPFIVHKSYSELSKGNRTIGIDKKMDKPWGIAFNNYTGVYAVSDISKHCVYIFDNQDIFVKELGSHGSEDSHFDGPQGVAFDSHDQLYIADFNNHRIQKFDHNFMYLQQFGKEAAGNEEFGPVAIAVHNERLYVVDSNNKCISVFLTNGFFCLTFGSEKLECGSQYTQ
ncbi:E3 ubiquitin-protein ligase TRIM71-like [Dysidea avara]|uniref:E3 ubiquitin-protein ligase TRIM71-like n=1 Tax=Dysidea avara TaxID=196820 RepID=UPI00331A12BA